MLDSFEIIYQPFFGDGKYRMQVEVLYKSEQVVRFRVHAGEKYIMMEKHLLKKSGQWKVPESNIDFVANGIEKSTYALFEIQEKLDEYLNRDTPRPSGNPKYEH